MYKISSGSFTKLLKNSYQKIFKATANTLLYFHTFKNFHLNQFTPKYITKGRKCPPLLKDGTVSMQANAVPLSLGAVL